MFSSVGVTYPQVKDLLAAPFPAARVAWKPQTISRDRCSALMVAFVDARTVMERLDAVCPGDWSLDVKLFPGQSGQPPTARGRLTVLGLTRSDVGEAGEGEAGTLKAAAFPSTCRNCPTGRCRRRNARPAPRTC